MIIAMTSRRKKLEREIARTEDPVIRMQLRGLLNKSGQQQEKIIRRIEEALVSLSHKATGRLPERAPLVLLFIVITIILLIIFLILEVGA